MTLTRSRWDEHKLVAAITPSGFSERLYADRPLNLAQLLQNTANRVGDQTGLIDATITLSYHQLLSASGNIASALDSTYGIRKGDRVALILRNSYEYVISLLALARLGAMAVPLNTALKGAELAFPLSDSGATLVIVEPDLSSLILANSSAIGGVKHVFVTGDQPVSGSIPFAELLKATSHVPIETSIAEDDGAVILYTSGTTGRPKGALLSHKNIIASAMNCAHLAALRAERDKMLIVAPLFHITGLALALYAGVYAGVPIVLSKRFKTTDMLETIRKQQITAMQAVPTMIWLMLHAPEFKPQDLASLRFLGTGGAPVPDDLVKICTERLPWVNLVPGYGLTEATGMTHSTINTAEALGKPGTVGRAAPVIDSKVVDSSGKETPPGVAGELLVRGSQVMREYWNNPEATRATIVDGWLRTGDIAAVTADGYTSILDRMKDMIIRGGENIYSTEVENVLYRIPKILEAAVVGIPDAVFGEQVKAVLVLKPGEAETAEEIQQYCKQHLADYKVPQRIEFRDSLPRNPAGKVLKQYLK